MSVARDGNYGLKNLSDVGSLSCCLSAFLLRASRFSASWAFQWYTSLHTNSSATCPSVQVELVSCASSDRAHRCTMTLRFLGTFLLLSVSFSVNEAVHKPSPLTSRASASSTVALQLRGGSVNVGKMVAELYSIQAAYTGLKSWLRPAKTVSKWGPTSAAAQDPAFQAAVARQGTSALSIATAAGLTLFLGIEPVKAIGYSCWPWILTGLDGMRPVAMKATGTKLWANLLVTGLPAALAYSCLTNQPWASKAIYTYAGWLALNFVTLTFFTKSTMEKVWRRSSTPLSSALLAYVSWTGIFLGMYAVHMYSLISGVEASRAVGYTLALCVPFHVWELLSGSATAIGMNQPALKSYLTQFTIMIAIILC